MIIAVVILNSLFSIKDRSTNFLTTELNSNIGSFKSVALDILNDTSINSICIQGDNSYRCEAINNWIKCPGDNWENRTLNKSVAKLDQVFQIEKIQKKHYDQIVDFMKKHQLKSIQIAFDCKTCVDFEASYNGLRYSNSDNFNFVTDHEYVIVNKIDKNWFSYERDIN